MTCADVAAGQEAATPQAQFAGQLSPEGTPPGPIGAVQAAQAAQNQQVTMLILPSSSYANLKRDAILDGITGILAMLQQPPCHLALLDEN